MKNTILNKLFFLALTIFIFSCSGDDNNSENENISNVFVELPADDLGTYKGSVFSSSVDEGINDGDVSCTLYESGNKTYTIDFSIDIPSLIDIQFIAIPDSSVSSTGLSNGFTTTVGDINNTTDLTGAIIVDDDEGNRSLTITIELESYTLIFGGQIQQ